MLGEKGIEFEDCKLKSTEEAETFKAQYQVKTTPQIFFGEERIGGYTDLATRLNGETEKTEYSYTPVIAIFSSAGLMSLFTCAGFSGFMGFSLSLLATLKLMDIKSFTKIFEKYDLVSQKIRPYAQVYPFAELAIALRFLSGAAPLATGTVSLFIGLSGGISVIKAVYIDKLDLNCACVGGNSRVPLGIISFCENAIMAIMGAALLFSFFTRKVESSKIKEPEPNIVTSNTLIWHDFRL